MPIMQNNMGTAKIQAIYNRILLKRVVQKVRIENHATTNNIPKKSNTKMGVVYRYKNMLPATVPLAEFDGANRIPGNKIVRDEVSYDIKPYGDYVKYNDHINLFDFRNIEADFGEILATQAADTLETVSVDILWAGTNVVYAAQGVSRADVAGTKKKITTEDLRLAAIKLKNQGSKKLKRVITGTTRVGTRPIRESFFSYAHASVIDDLRQLPGWKNAEDYPSGKYMDGEAGSWGDFRFVEYDFAKFWDVGGTNVYGTILFGSDAYAVSGIRGKKKVEMIIKPLGSAGSSDPLNQEASVGWKAWHGAKILNQAFMVRLESTVTIEDTTKKHYYDYS